MAHYVAYDYVLKKKNNEFTISPYGPVNWLPRFD